MGADLHGHVSEAVRLAKQFRDDELRARWARKVGEVTLGRSFSEFIPLQYSVPDGPTGDEAFDRHLIPAPAHTKQPILPMRSWEVTHKVPLPLIQLTKDDLAPVFNELGSAVRSAFRSPSRRPAEQLPPIPDSGLLIPILDLRYESPMHWIGAGYRFPEP